MSKRSSGPIFAAEEIEIDLVPIGREVASVPPKRTEGAVTIIPVLEEVVHVEKRPVLVEEIHVRRTSRVQQKSTPVTLRKQRVVIENVAPSKSAGKNTSSQPTNDEDDGS
jgi:stress response protein YsnF